MRAAVMVAALVPVFACAQDRRSPEGGVTRAAPGDPGARAPAGVRVKVEVLNATKRPGLARHAAIYLRDMGFDVVAFGTSRSLQDSTTVLDRSGHAEWAARLGRAMRARVIERPDTSRYLDATVVLGDDWTPPARPFHP